MVIYSGTLTAGDVEWHLVHVTQDGVETPVAAEVPRGHQADLVGGSLFGARHNEVRRSGSVQVQEGVRP